MYGITSAGCGLTALRSFCSAMNIPPPIYPHTFNKYIRYISAIAEKNCQDSMNEAASKLRYGNEIATVSVSVDRTWQKRYGHNSLLGASFIFSIDMVLYSIMLLKAKHVNFVREIQMLQKIGRRPTNQHVESTIHNLLGQWKRKLLWKCLSILSNVEN